MRQKLLCIITLLIFQLSFSQTLTLDTTFGTSGKVVNPLITSAQAIQLQNDGKIVSCYLEDFSISGNVRLTRFNSDGTIDTAFGNNGYVTTTIVSESGLTNMMKLQPDGKILVTGTVSSNGGNNASYFDFCTARFNIDGTLDTGFGVNGYAVTGFEDLSYDQAAVVEIQADGKILVGGHSSRHYLSSTNSSLDFAVIRYLSDGAIDTSFAENGKFTYNFGIHTVPHSGSYSHDYVVGIKINSTGKIVVGGDTTVDEVLEDFGKFGFVVLNPNGTLDASFGSNGQRVVDIGERAYMMNFKLTADDKIIATGQNSFYVGATNHASIPLVKLSSDGNFDAGFGNNGIVLTNRDSSNFLDVSNDLNIMPDGRIICAGATVNETGLGADFLLIAFNADGSIDRSFNATGYKTVNFNDSSASAFSFLIQPDGKFLCAGAIDFSVGCLVRLEAENLSVNPLEKKIFTVYPNPFSDSITIESQNADLTNAEVGIFDIGGRKLCAYKLQDSSSFTIPVNADLSSGNYFLKIVNQEQSRTIKIIKR